MNHPKSTSIRRLGRPRGGRLIADREALLEAAERAIRMHGPDVTMESIAAEAAVTKPIVYRSVGDKNAVAAALAERFVDRINAAGFAARTGATDPRDALRRLVGSFVEAVDGDRNLYMFVTDAGSNDDRLGNVLRLADRSARPIAEDLAAQRVADGRDPALAAASAYGLIGTLHFATLWWLRDGTLSAADLTDHLTELIWSGVASTVQPAAAEN